MKNTSINRYNVAVVDQSGKVGTVRYYQRGGRTYVRSAANRVDSNSNPRTDAQMKARLMYNSKVAMYRLFKGLLKDAFQFKPRYMTPYQAFMQANANIGCYMTKDEYRGGKIIPMPVKVAEGELKGIGVAYDSVNDKLITQLSTGSASNISTIADLSKAIVDNNDGFEYGDQLTVINLRFNYITPASREVSVIVLDESNTTPQSVFTASGGKLELNISETDNLISVIHSNSNRQMSNSTAVLFRGAASTYDAYVSDDAFQAARDSYGKAKESVLVPAKA